MLTRAIRPARIVLYFSLFTFSFSLLSVLAQDDPELAPPPLRTVTKDEKTKLNGESDIKLRTILALNMMSLRLMNAEDLNLKADFDGMFRELGGFHGLLDFTLDFLKLQDTNNKRALDNFKRLELGLRGFSPRLEAIHRDLPVRYEDYVRKLLVFVREARTKAVEPLFSNTVVPSEKPHEP